ncbi:DUF3048 domain-containing protein [Pseudalkalibacillus decolorationis]|uniref:DUF3048 domain-containing protein n=1 Tax=Pseudalkalibacillus decolorationis TaxID=163879 RepID=UPI002148EC71|nr:DUF3048 domain-containing protein [Pseudalkalibacillus decolorationis]
MKKQGLFVTFIVALFLMLSACQTKETSTNADKKGTEDPKKETKKEEQQPKEENKEPEFAYTFPLTGKDTNEAVINRVVGIMVNNSPKARPQSGLHKADVVYEVLAEGRITRFLALFQSQKPEKVGPVRSARDYYVRLSNGFDAIYVHHGWSPSAKEMLLGGNIDSLNGLYYDGTLFKRVSFRKAPHNSYITFDNILKESKKQKYELKQEIPSLPFLTKEEVKSIEGDPAKTLSISYGDYYKVEYKYQPEKGTYIRFSDSEQTVDRETETPIELANVMVVEAHHRVIDSVGRRQIDLQSGGSALLFQQGKVQQVSWVNKNGRIIPKVDGKVVAFAPGQIWINLVPAPDMDKDVNWK